MFLIRWFAYVLFLSAWVVAQAQADDRFFRMRHYDTAQGLVHSTVVAIEEDHLGFIWIGTPNGLNRFDGIRLYSYTPASHPNIPHPRITALLADIEGRLWVGTRDGIAQYNHDTDNFRVVLIEDKDPALPFSIYNFVRTSNGEILAATNQGLFIYSETKDSFHRHPGDHPWLTQPIRGALAAPDGSILLGVQGYGLLKLKGEKATEILSTKNHPSLSEIRTIATTANGTIWLGTRRGLFRIPDKGPLSQVQLSGARAPLITQLHVDVHGNLWIGSYVNGLWIIDTNGHQHRLYPSLLFHQSLTDKQIFALTHTADGSLWIGTYSGLFHLSGQAAQMPYIMLSEPKDLVERAQWVSWIEPDGDHLWVAQLRKGLWHISPKTGQRRLIHTPHPLPYVIRKAPQGGFWVGFDGGGLYHYSPTQNRFIKFDETQGLAAKWITRVFVDKAGVSWIGTNNGLYRYHPEQGRFEEVRLIPEGSARPFILAINSDDPDYLWVGTTVHGLYRVDVKTGQILNFRHQVNDEKSLLHNLIYDIHVDGESVFVATRAGLSKVTLRDFTLTHLTRDNGLPENTTFAIRARSDDLLWVGTEQGLVLIDRNLNILNVINLRKGLFALPRAYGGFAVDRSALWVGYNGGLSHIPAFPQNLFSTARPSPPIIEQVFIDGQPKLPHYMAADGQKRAFTLTAPHSHQSIRFVLAAPLLRRLGEGDVQYRLHGLNNKWISLSDPTYTISYTNVPAGSYTLELKTRLANVQSATYRPIILYVASPPLLSPFALTIYVVIALLIVVYWRQRHIHQLREAQALQEKLRAADKAKDELLSNVSHELRTPLNGIMGMAQLLRDGMLGDVSQDIKNAVDDIFYAGLRLNLLVGNLITLSQLKAGDFAVRYEQFSPRPTVEKILRLLNSNQNKKHDIDIRIEIEPKLIITTDKSIFELVMTNLIQNALKFTNQGFIEIRVEQVDNQWMISVADSGIGMSPELQDTVLKPFQQRDSSLSRLHGGLGLGLSICQQLLALIDSHLWINSHEGEGSIFSFYLPITPANR